MCFGVVGVIGLVLIVVIIVIVLVRRGVIHPVERARNIKRAVTRRYRERVYGEGRVNHAYTGSPPPYSKNPKRGHVTYDVRFKYCLVLINYLTINKLY